ncbi:MAG: hypothetical protein KAI57_04525 [Candidatus Pacebacteria bacterium]|nr:hypothetical protein [Candidatus Paceibacterota bacterium]
MFELVHIILKRKKYAFIAIVTFIIMTAVSYRLTVINVFHNDIFIYAQMNTYVYTLVSVLLGLIISVLFGFYMALLFFRKDISIKVKKNDTTVGAIGTGIGIVASGCPGCGVPLLGLIGIPLGLSYLPFKGIELKILSITLLLISVYYISVSIKKNLSCGLK